MKAQSLFRSSVEYTILRIGQELKLAPSWVESAALLPLSFALRGSRVLRALMPYRVSIGDALLALSGTDAVQFLAEFEELEFVRRTRPWARLEVGRDVSEFLYCLIRAARPKTVVETGVSSGFSSAIILLAMEANGVGELYSIEKFRYPLDLKGKNCGWLVPGELRKRWELVIGDSKEQLPRLLGRIGRADIFFHDSDHSYENMAWEMSTAWHSMPPGGILLADNVNFNLAFLEFCREEGRRPVVLDFAPGLPSSIELFGATRKA